MSGDEQEAAVLPTVAARPSVGRVRVHYAVAGVTLVLALLPWGGVWLWVLALLVCASAYAGGVARLRVDADGIARRDALGLLHELAWTDVQAVELRDTDWRRVAEGGSSMVVVGQDGQQVHVFSVALPAATRLARRAVVEHAKARGIQLVDRRTRGRAG